jgi:hypothetical protein
MRRQRMQERQRIALYVREGMPLADAARVVNVPYRLAWKWLRSTSLHGRGRRVASKAGPDDFARLASLATPDRTCREISAIMGRCERWVQQARTDLGLPVHRVGRKSRCRLRATEAA